MAIYQVTDINSFLRQYGKLPTDSISQTGSSVSKGTSVGDSFTDALRQLMASPNGNEAGADLAALQTDDEEGIAAEKNTDLNNRIKNFEVLQNKQPNPVEWQRVFNEQPVSEETDYSILSTIGEGLLTAGKIAAAILL